MRVVAGTAGGRRLVAPRGLATRPTSDRVREAVFNALGSMGSVRGARVLDLFAGSGAMGIEALSRGAERATFVDSEPVALRAVAQNLEATGLTGRADLVRADALVHLRSLRNPRASAEVDRLAPTPDPLRQLLSAPDHSPAGSFDLVIADPPYAFDRWDRLLTELIELFPGAVVVAESDRDVDPPGDASVLRRRRYGGTVVTLMTLTGDAPSPTTEDAT